MVSWWCWWDFNGDFLGLNLKFSRFSMVQLCLPSPIETMTIWKELKSIKTIDNILRTLLFMCVSFWGSPKRGKTQIDGDIYSARCQPVRLTRMTEVRIARIATVTWYPQWSTAKGWIRRFRASHYNKECLEWRITHDAWLYAFGFTLVHESESLIYHDSHWRLKVLNSKNST